MAKIKIKQIKSQIGAPKDQKETLRALGLRKISQIIEVEDTPSCRGMIRKVHHLVSVID
ncbi:MULTISPECIES: 50S ribosomal protein L30 [Prevotella]|jgi:ribosomal protein L30|uniref:50S ribosomal protein L30 n=1 Tax=Prevotella TaxID=838 RepID=UPI00022374BA|nr:MULTISPECIES: 50S ribosomal protein L30 [Prevotella]EGW46528.1 50S ribosomal protein L30 [Prevotella sp. C561]MBW4772637.1 50S ribosomal protein L30 [Prevotella jejuni]QUB78518.1 50S ribosomal protein L30 [Prevotella jejuni]QUB80294.1 50S ribosomal protein L30 [Prevotella jejuni]